MKAGQLKVISVIGDKRLDIFPDVSTTTDQGIDSAKVPVQFRAVMGAPDMPEDAVQKYQDDLSKMVETEDWKTLTKSDGLVTQNLQDDEFTRVPEGADRYRRRPAAGAGPEEGSVTPADGPSSLLARFVAEHKVRADTRTGSARGPAGTCRPHRGDGERLGRRHHPAGPRRRRGKRKYR